MELWEKTVESETLFEGKIVTLKLDKAQLVNGRIARREVVEHPGGVAVLPLFDDGTVSIVRQFRYPFQAVVTELPAGKLEAGEDPFEAAKRELEEECGVTADEYIPLGCIYPTVGYDSEKIHIWIARGLHATRQHLDEDEFLDVHKLPFDQVLQMVLDNTIRDSKTVAAVLRYALMRGQGQ